MAPTVVALSAVVGLILPGVAPAAEARRPGNTPPAPDTVCRLEDPTLAEVSGLVAGDDRWWVVNDGGTDVRVHVVDRNCAVSDVLTDPTDPYDVEDLARAADGTFWLADVGDNRGQRDTVALHALRPGHGSTLYRLTYPDGAHDAEALVLDRDGTPHIVTKNMTGTSAVYRPAASLRSPGPTPLEKVGSVSVSPTATRGGPVGAAGSLLVTGGATSHDGRVVALRTYTDAYLYPAPDGDVVAALERDPVRVPLPGEPQGEAIAFAPDGSLVSASEGVGNPIRVVPGAAGLVSGRSGGNGPGDDRSWTSQDGTGDDSQHGAGPSGSAGAERQGREAAADARRRDDAPGLPLVPLGAGIAAVALVAATAVAVRRRRG